MAGLLYFTLTFYLLIVRLSLADDYPNDSTTTYFLMPGGSRTGILETSSDRDWFKTYLLAGRTYTISGSAGFDTVLYLHKAGPPVTQVGYDDDGGVGSNPLLTYTPSSSETFFVVYAPFSSGTGSYFVEISDTTSTCSAGCLTCVNTLLGCSICQASKMCTSCTSGAAYYAGACVASCPPGTTRVSNICTTCSTVSNCLACPNGSTCTVCSGAKLVHQGTCVDSCPSGFIPILRTCTACTSPCATCSVSLTSCTGCSGSYPYLHGTTCVTSCPSGYYGTSNSCMACSSPCAQCSGSATTCTGCSGSKPKLYNSTCWATCPAGSYSSSSSACSTCSNTCATCSGSATTCTGCSGTTPYLHLSSCVTSCPSGYYATSTNSCAACSSPCAQCSGSATTCTGCAGSKPYLHLSTCLASCTSGFYADSPNSCAACSSPCATCSGTATTCTGCSGSKPKLYSSTCWATCPAGSYSSSSSACSICSTLCATCSGTAATCTGCSGTTPYLHLSSCIASCPSGYYANPTNSCATCSSPCDTCSGSATTCTGCSGIKPYLHLSTCVANCPVGFYANSPNSCDACLIPCAACLGTATTCVACPASDPYLYNFKCWVTCPAGTYTSSSTACSACSSPCDTCSGDATTCTGCSGATPYLHDSTCVSICPDGYYTSQDNSCLACQSPCRTCLGSATLCTGCNTDAPYLTDNTCKANSMLAAALVGQTPPAISAALTAASLFSSGGSAAILFGGLQKLITYIKYLRLPYSSSLSDMLKASQSGIFALDIYPALPSSLLAYLVSKPIPDIFIEYEVDPSFLVNFWKNLITLVGVTITWILLKLIMKFILTKKISRKLYSLLNIVELMLIKFLIVELYSCYGDVTMFSSLEIQSVDYQIVLSSVSFGICITFLTLTLCVSCFHIWFLLRYQKFNKAKSSKANKREKEAFLKKYENFGLLYIEFRDESFSQQAYLLYFNLRDAALNLVITILFGYPLVQSILFVIIAGVFLLYIIITKPLTFMKQNLLQIAFEMILLLIYVCAMIIAINVEWYDSLDLPDTLSQVIVILTFVYNGGSLFITLVTILVPLIISIKRWWTRRKGKKTQYLRKITRSETSKSQLASYETHSIQLEEYVQSKSKQNSVSTLAALSTSENTIKSQSNSQLRRNQLRSKWTDSKIKNRIKNAFTTLNDSSLPMEDLSLPERNVLETRGPRPLPKSKLPRRNQTQLPKYETSVLSDGTVVKKRNFKA